MSKNIKLLNEEELRSLEKMYTFKIIGGFIVVETTSIKRRVAHEKNQDFRLNTRIRNITISKEAIEYWSIINSDNYSLFRIQNIMNLLECTYQRNDFESVKDFIENNKK